MKESGTRLLVEMYERCHRQIVFGIEAREPMGLPARICAAKVGANDAVSVHAVQ